jgi:DNA-binding beta-propeller fold protein YncE
MALDSAKVYTITASNSGGSTTASLTLTVNDVPPSALTYSGNPAVYTKGTVITANTPTSSGGDVVGYSISPALPTGLSLSTVTGAISGTPTALSASTIYTINANNSGGTATVLLTVTVNAPPTAPVISTPTTTGITSTNAVLGGLVVSDGGASLTAVGIVYAPSATNPNPQIGGIGVTNLIAANAPGAFTVNVSGLAPSTAYSFKAYAVNSLGTSYTAPATTFTTPVAPVCSLGASSLLEGPAAGTDSILLNVLPSTGSWTAAANDSWLHLNASNASGTGGALVVFTFDANPGTTRTGTLTIGGQTLTVQQAGSTYAVANPLITLVPGILSSPQSVAVDNLGNIYIADTGNNAIRKWTAATQTMSTLVSSGLNFPDGLAVDAAGNVYIGDSNNGKVKKWSADTQTVSILVNGVAASGLAVDPAGNVFIADWGSKTIKKWSAATQTVSTLVSSGLSFPSGVAVDSAGDIYIADRGNDTLKKWTVSTQTLSTLASAGLNSPYNVALDGAGNVYIASSGGNSVKKWTAATQTLSTPVSAGLSGPVGVAVDSAGNLIIADTGHSAIKQWTASTQTLSTLVSAALSSPTGVAADGIGNVYIADNKNDAIKKWSVGNQAATALVSSGLSMPTGVAIDGSGSLYSVDWGTSSGAVRKWNSATQTLNSLATGFNSPGGVAVDSAGNLFISDTGRHAIKKWNSSSQTTTTLVSSGLSFPRGIAVDWLGKVFIADTNNRQVKVWDPATQAVTTLLPTVGISWPNGLAVDGSGNVYVADVGLNVINIWSAATQTLRTKVAAGLRRPYGVAVDALNNIYIADSTANAIFEMPNAYVDSTSKSEPFSAGSDSLPAVLPTATNLLPPFAPTSDQPWLTIGSITNGVVSFSFTTNTGASRSAHINLLGKTITVTQAAAPLSSNALLSNLVLGGGGILAPTFTGGTTVYAMSVVNTVDTLTVTPTTAESHSVVRVSNVVTNSGTASAPIALVVGPNNIDVVVTAQDGVTVQTYRIVVTRMTASDSWWLQRFGTTSHTGDAADDADPRHTGIPNLIDYALHKENGGNISGRDILPQPARGGDKKLHITFTRYLDRNDITVSVQGADSPGGPWTDLASSVGGAPFNVTQPGATVEETGTGNARSISVGDVYLFSDPAHPRRFMRLKVTRH